MENKEKEYTFYIGNPNGPDTPYTLKESELERSHQELLYANLLQAWNRGSKEAQTRFLHELSFEIKQKEFLRSMEVKTVKQAELYDLLLEELMRNKKGGE